MPRFVVYFFVVLWLIFAATIGCNPPQSDPAPVPPVPVPIDPEPEPAPADPEPAPSDRIANEKAIVDAHTVARGGSALLVDQKLVEMARKHAQWMAENRDMTHDRPQAFGIRFRDSGYAGYGGGENIAWGQRNVKQVMDAWMKSPGHRRNILGNWTHVGASYAFDKNGVPFWCVVFGRSHAAAAEDWDTLPPPILEEGDE